MDDQTQMTIDGSRNLPEETNDPPLVTFALFAYNQEKYIREAVEGAFSQSYSPLEIILSDDCSSDRTFEIMQEMAAGYVGPHQVIVRKGVENAGLAEHINSVSREISGSIVVVAAGDDTSKPERAEKLVQVYKAHPGTFAVFSDYETLPRSTQKKYHLKKRGPITGPEIIYNGGGVQIGATYSYRRECFLWPGPIPSWIQSEDRLLPFRAMLLGSVRYLPSSLVDYRISTDPAEIKRRSTRIHGFNHHRHFPNLKNELHMARRQGHVTWWREALLGAFLKARSAHITLLGKRWLPNGIVNSIFLPLRGVRKLSIMWASRVEVNGRKSHG